jgi:uncharacterized protein
MSPVHRWVLRWARFLHLTLTMMGLALVLFFAITGFMLNHEDWFVSEEPPTVTQEGTLSTQFLEGPDRLAIVEQLRAEFGATGAMTSFEVEEDRLRIEFKAPGRQSVATVDRETAQVEVQHEFRGLAGRLVDLHRGKAAGKQWGLLIDATCILLLAISLTGLLMWSSLKTRWRLGAASFVLGTVVGLAVYIASVP